ncbi:3-hydroxy acid dehydrogenase/malonic semialdehyde reductase [Dysgonomonas sp. PH5-45]|uniref:SDR family NAD(P)-dependent oxidoreductase n=1 Tax=unclassified Dysgonomonas TaxID=2630389 RepID=UPI002473E393|nr:MULTISPECIES: SDR family NAD(P)-dependent oxidoreductase [unclassified Dysgonomonas]MDH6355793.1 3-hydroxy acid dehydrogenase/malonic semialdehyde reductase [Dysgonomonas sp. PH5-45]MDH6388691.1 3-hydroxy acid dehydrogenase/malonic semialdehyde reductase [Dysgonomonas sp. PH5-37]
MKKTALITGATSGIGRATALRLAKEGFDIIITGRRKERLAELETEISTLYPQTKVTPLCFDVRNCNEVEKHLAPITKVDVLVNNAGLAVGANPIHMGVVDDWERMIDTNVKGLLYVTRVISPKMVEQKSGHIINIGSIAGKEVYPNGNVYCATKHAVDAISKGIRMDLVHYGIKVTQICPGAAETEFSLVRYKGDQATADKVYDGFTPLVAEDIANTIAYAVLAPDHVDVQDILIMSKAQATATIFHKE